jgi:hypothetical protein
MPPPSRRSAGPLRRDRRTSLGLRSLNIGQAGERAALAVLDPIHRHAEDHASCNGPPLGWYGTRQGTTWRPSTKVVQWARTLSGNAAMVQTLLVTASL